MNIQWRKTLSETSGPAYLKRAVLHPSWVPQLLGFQLPSLFLPGSNFTYPCEGSHWRPWAGLHLLSPIFPFELGPCVSPQGGSSVVKFSLTNKGKEPTSCWTQAAGKSRFLLHICGHLQEFWGSPAILRSSKDCAWSEISQPLLLVRIDQMQTPDTSYALGCSYKTLFLTGKAWVFLLAWWQGSVFLPKVVLFTFACAEE